MTKRETLEEASYRVRSEMCRGCEHLCDRIQEQYWDASGRFRLDTPIKEIKKYCRSYELHLDYIDRLHACMAKDGKRKECDRFRN